MFGSIRLWIITAEDYTRDSFDHPEAGRVIIKLDLQVAKFN
jgi:hypothetical protein